MSKSIYDFSCKELIKAVVFDFDGVFTDNSVYVDQTGNETVRCTRYDGFGLQNLMSGGVYVAVITTETSTNAASRCRKLKIPCYDNVRDKLMVAERLLSDAGISLGNTAFLGNDINDLELLSAVVFPVAPPDAHQSVLRMPDIYLTQSPGGCGCVRELCDFIVQ